MAFCLCLCLCRPVLTGQSCVISMFLCLCRWCSHLFVRVLVLMSLVFSPVCACAYAYVAGVLTCLCVCLCLCRWCSHQFIRVLVLMSLVFSPVCGCACAYVAGVLTCLCVCLCLCRWCSHLFVRVLVLMSLVFSPVCACAYAYAYVLVKTSPYSFRLPSCLHLFQFARYDYPQNLYCQPSAKPL